MSQSVERLHRSFLFVPGTRVERFDKALSSGADAVIVDLEDAVAPEDKDRAREAVAAWVSPERPVLIRINAVGTQWFEQDAALCRLRGIAGVVLPKAERGADVSRLVSLAGDAMPVYPLIESAQGMWNAMEVAKAPSVRQLMFGTLDFCADMGMASDGDELNTFRAELVMISRVAGIAAPVDGVTAAVDDANLLEADTLRAKRWGFAGKLCIHPRQVSTVNAGFSPSEADVAWALKVLDAFDRANGAAVAVDGEMVDLPVVLRARRCLATRIK